MLANSTSRRPVKKFELTRDSNYGGNAKEKRSGRTSIIRILNFTSTCDKKDLSQFVHMNYFTLYG